MRGLLLGAAAGLLVLALSGTVQASDYGHYGYGRGHYHYHPGRFVRHWDHYHYRPGHFHYHRGPDYYPGGGYYGGGYYGGCCYHPVATAAAVTATAMVTAAVVGSIVHTLPPSCTSIVVNSSGRSTTSPCACAVCATR